MKQYRVQLIYFWKLGLLFTPILLFLFTGPLQISCGSATDSTTNDAEIISDLPESIPAPIARSEVDIGVDPTSPTVTENSSGDITLSGEILGDVSNATVIMYIGGKFADSVVASNFQFSFSITEAQLELGLSFVVLLKGTATNPQEVSPPVVAKVYRVDNKPILQIAVTNVIQSTSYQAIAANIQNNRNNSPVLDLSTNIVYFSAVDADGKPAVFKQDLARGGFNSLLTNELENLIQHTSLLNGSLFGTDIENGLLRTIDINDGTITSELDNLIGTIPADRFFVHSPDGLWRAIINQTDTLVIELELVDDIAVYGALITPPETISAMQFDFISETNVSSSKLLVIKEFESTYELQILEIDSLPGNSNDNQEVTLTILVSTSNFIGEPVVNPQDREEEAIYLCENDEGTRNVCHVELRNNGLTTFVQGDGFNIVRAQWTGGVDVPIILEADYDSTTLTDNRIFLYNRSTNTFRLLTFGYNFKIDITSGIVTFLIQDVDGNNQVGIFNLNNL